MYSTDYLILQSEVY